MTVLREEEQALRDTDLAPPALQERLHATWEERAGLWGWLCSVDHKSIGRRYIVTAFCFLALGGLMAVLIRLQLGRPDSPIVDPDLYNQIFTMHGATMMFLFAVPVMDAIAIYIVPLMLGTRVIAFPRLNAYSYWVYLSGGIMLWVAFLANTGPDVGWFSYVPLAGPSFGAGKRADFWAQLITFTEIAALCVAVELVVVTFRQRAPGMSLDRIPIFVWAMLVTSFCVIFAMPSVVVGSSMLIADRLIGTHFFNPAEGGDVLLWQHLFWFFGHPEVYIIFLPAVGMASTIVEAAAGRPIFGYPLIVLSLIAIGFLSFGLWVHHMFVAGLPRLGNSFFTASSIAIAIPSGIQIFCWIATIWGGRLRIDVPILFVFGFVFLFVLGGMTGVMIASVPFDLQATDTYFIVGHIHYVLLGGAVAPLLGAVFYWFPKFTGRMLSERLGYWQFGFYFVGANLAFAPMLILGLHGMTRRIYTYPDEFGWGGLNFLSTVGATLMVVSFLLFAVNIARALSRPASAPDNPWQAGTLEWATSSPPPPYNFTFIPWVKDTHPLWANPDGVPYVTGLKVDKKEILITSGLDATPTIREPIPGATIWPLIAGVATTIMLIASIYTPAAIVWGGIIVGLAILGWLYPRSAEAPVPAECEAEERS
jgi:cytochrome c oxidase subunit I